MEIAHGAPVTDPVVRVLIGAATLFCTELLRELCQGRVLVPLFAHPRGDDDVVVLSTKDFLESSEPIGELLGGRPEHVGEGTG